MVYRFVINKLMNDSDVKSEFSDVISNWIDYYKTRTNSIGMCFNDTKTLSFIAPIDDDDNDKKYAFEFKFKYTKK